MSKTDTRVMTAHVPVSMADSLGSDQPLPVPR
jgi:hypothetical protein